LLELSMPIYISWSGQTSFKIAQNLHQMIRSIFPGQEVWVSAEDIQDGARWSPDLLRILDRASFCIMCIDPSNAHSPWLHFELGAVAKATSKWRIRVLLNELTPEELKGPVTLFQGVRIEKGDVRRMVEDIHANLSNSPLNHVQVIANLEEAWPDFQETVSKINLELSIKAKEKLAEAEKKAVAEREESSEPVLMAHINEVDEKILVLLCVNEGLEEEKIATTVYLPRGSAQHHLIELEKKGLVWSNLMFGVRRWFITDLGKKYVPAYYQD
jgi:hypothetical protein